MRILTTLTVTLLIGCSGTLNVGHSSTGGSGSTAASTGTATATGATTATTTATGSSTGGSTGSTTSGGQCTQGGELCAVHSPNTCCPGIACSARSSNDGFCCNDLGGTCASNVQCCGDLVCANGLCSGGSCFNANCDPSVPCCTGSFCSGWSASSEGSCVPSVADAGCGTGVACGGDQLCCPWEGGAEGGVGYQCAPPTDAGVCPVGIEPDPGTFACGPDGGCSSTLACQGTCDQDESFDYACVSLPANCVVPTCECLTDAGIFPDFCTDDGGGVSYFIGGC